MKNRIHEAKKVKTLQVICNKGNIPFPIEEENNILVEVDPKQGLPIYRNFPKRTYSVNTEDAWEIIELLAYEAHEWQAYEILRFYKTKKGLYKHPLLT